MNNHILFASRSFTVIVTAMVLLFAATGRSATTHVVTFDTGEYIPAHIEAVGGGSPNIPDALALMQNYPNPFNPETRIEYALPTESIVALSVYNVLGQEVARLVNGERPAGFHTVTWNGRNSSGVSLGSGMYIYKIEAKPNSGGEIFRQVRKMSLLK